ncbi:MAG: sensor histidine kinase [Ilumatobacteraceae bacterium]
MPARRRWTLRRRITLGATVTLTIILAVVAFAGAALLRRALAGEAQSLLLDRVDEVQSLINDGLLSPVLAPTGRDVDQVQVIDIGGNVVAVTPGLAGTTRLDVIPEPAIGQQTTALVDGGRIDRQEGEEYRVVARTVDTDSGPLTIYGVTSLLAAHHAEDYFRNGFLIALPLLVGVSAWMISKAVGRALAPVAAMRAEVDRIEATDLSGRVATDTSDDEIGKLGHTRNRRLGRLEDAGTERKLYAAAASHELRSPLSAIRTDLEVGLAFPERAEWPRIATDSLIELARLERLSQDLRMLTGSTSMRSVSRPLNLGRLVAAEVAERRPPTSVAYRTHIDEATVSADTDGVVRVVRNLLDNAERHARSEICVDVSRAAEGVTLSVCNDGEPIAPADRERIFDPFTRLDEARSLDTGGSGLGLAIARALAAGWEGTLNAADRAVGAAFVAWFPPMPA